MPIRFACPECRQLLGVATRKAGSQVACPKCQAAITVPTQKEADRAAALGRFETPDIEETLSNLVVYDRTPEGRAMPAGGRQAADREAAARHAAAGHAGLKYTAEGKETSGQRESEQSEAGRPTAETYAAAGRRLASDERTTLLIPRKVVYFQAGLLAAVAVLFFAAGVWIGYGTRRETPQEANVGSATLDVLLHYRDNGDLRPDEGAVVLVLPALAEGKGILEKVAAGPLMPGAPPLNAASPAMSKINLLGGAYGRTDAAGKLSGLVVPRSGPHHVLLLSNHARRSGEPRPQDLAALATYVEGATELLADRQYRLTTEELRGTAAVGYDFGSNAE
jgi:hypothetical protein